MLIKPKDRIVLLGDEEVCGTAEAVGRCHVTGEEREYIDNALAGLETRDKLAADFVDATYKENKSFQKGDYLDYVIDSDRLPFSMIEKIESTKWVQESRSSAAGLLFNKQSNGILFARLKAFLELRLVDENLREAVKAMSLEDASERGKAFNRGFWAYVYYFYSAEQEGLLYSFNLHSDENGREQHPFLYLDLIFSRVQPIPSLEAPSTSSVQNCTLPEVATTELVSEVGPNEELVPF